MWKQRAVTLCGCLAILPIVTGCSYGVGGPPQAYAPGSGYAPPAAYSPPQAYAPAAPIGVQPADSGAVPVYAIRPNTPAAIVVMLPGPGDIVSASPQLWADQGFDVVTAPPAEFYRLAAGQQAAAARLIAQATSARRRTDLASRAKSGDRGGDGIDAAGRTGTGVGGGRHLDQHRRRHLQRADGLLVFGERRRAKGFGQQIRQCLPPWLGVRAAVDRPRDKFDRGSAATRGPAPCSATDRDLHASGRSPAPRVIEAAVPAHANSPAQRAAVQQIADEIKSAPPG